MHPVALIGAVVGKAENHDAKLSDKPLGGSGDMMRIAPMTPADLARALDWASSEGWNPGVDDAAAFHAADPNGFFMGWIDEEPVAAIAAVRHGVDYGFIGLFLVRPEWRGKGYGRAIWRAGMAHLDGARTIGLDGVAEQRAYYERAGFVVAHRTIRHSGAVPPETWARTRQSHPDWIPDMIALDAAASGVERSAYLKAWFTDTPTRHTLVFVDSGVVTGVGTIRACREGHKIGPLIMPTGKEAEAMLRALAAEFGARGLIIDIPEGNAAALAAAEHLGFKPVHETARMYRGPAPVRDLGRMFGEVTLEVG